MTGQEGKALVEQKQKKVRKPKRLPAPFPLHNNNPTYLIFPTFNRYSAICTAFSAAPFLI